MRDIRKQPKPDETHAGEVLSQVYGNNKVQRNFTNSGNGKELPYSSHSRMPRGEPGPHLETVLKRELHPSKELKQWESIHVHSS